MPLLASPRLSLPSHLVFVDCPAAHNNMIDDLFAFWRCRICSRPAEHLQLREGCGTVLGRLRPTWTNVHECSVQFPLTGQCEYIPLCTVCVDASPPMFVPLLQFVRFCSTIGAFSLSPRLRNALRLPLWFPPPPTPTPEEQSSASFYCTI